MEKEKEWNYSAGIYARLSVDHGVKSESIASQIAIAKSYLEQQTDMILYDCYIDLGKSGTDFKRDGFLKLMEDIRNQKVNCVIVKDFSRFGRNYLEVGNYIEKIFPFLGVRFISVTDEFDSQKKEENEMDRNLKNLVNEMYAKDIAGKVHTIKSQSKKQGSYIGGRPPYGYQIERMNGRRCLVMDKAAFEIVRKIVQLFIEGKSQKEIINWLYQNQVHRPSDYNRYGSVYCRKGEQLFEWQRGTIRQIIKNSIDKEQKEEGILSKEPYQIIQKGNRYITPLKKRNSCKNESKIVKKLDYSKEQQKEKQHNHSEKIWKGILYCGDCGCKLSYKGKKKGIYYCRRAERIDFLQCNKKQITQEKISDCIRIFFQKVFQKEKGFSEFWDIEKEELERFFQGRKKQTVQKQMMQIKRISMQIIALERMISEDYRSYQGGRIEKEKFIAEKVKKNKKIERLLEKKWLKEQQIRKLLTDKMDFIYMILEGKKDWLKEEIFFSMIIKRIMVFDKKRIVIQFRIKANSVSDSERNFL